MGLSKKTWKQIGYETKDFLKFYRQSLDYILKLNIKGRLLIERGLFYSLKKILNKEDPAYMEMRSPCGAAIGQMAFDYDGKIYTCDEGRMASRMGKNDFKIGNVNNSYRQLIDNETTKITCLASILENHPSCNDCPYKPYCGTCPVINFVEYNTIFPILPLTMRCQINQAMFDYIFLKLKNIKYKKVFENWLDTNKII